MLNAGENKTESGPVARPGVARRRPQRSGVPRVVAWLVALLLLAPCAPVWADNVAPAARPAAAVPVTARDLARFDQINSLARQIQRRYSQAFAHARTRQQAQQVAQAMDRAVTRMFRRQGMSEARYRRVRHYLMREALNSPSRPMQVAGTAAPAGGGS